jgi:hypothetical protein
LSVREVFEEEVDAEGGGGLDKIVPESKCAIVDAGNKIRG